MPRYTQVTRQEFPSTDPERRGQIDVAYVYTDEHFRTIMVKIPKENDTAEQVEAQLRIEAARAAGAGPREIVIE